MCGEWSKIYSVKIELANFVKIELAYSVKMAERISKILNSQAKITFAILTTTEIFSKMIEKLWSNSDIWPKMLNAKLNSEKQLLIGYHSVRNIVTNVLIKLLESFLTGQSLFQCSSNWSNRNKEKRRAWQLNLMLQLLYNLQNLSFTERSLRHFIDVILMWLGLLIVKYIAWYFTVVFNFGQILLNNCVGKILH